MHYTTKYKILDEKKRVATVTLEKLMKKKLLRSIEEWKACFGSD